MMAACQPPVTAVAMKMTLMNTTKRLAAMLAGMRANVPRRAEVDYMCRRLAVRLQSRFDAEALNPWRGRAR
jgi:hypothetical protein